jgi:hypothetical protein
MTRSHLQKIQIVDAEHGSFQKNVPTKLLLIAVLFTESKIECINAFSIPVDGLDAFLNE